MSAQEVPLLDRLVGEVGEFAAWLGLDRSVGLLYAFLYMSRTRRSLDDMCETGPMSKGCVSFNIRALERTGVVCRVWV